LRISNNELTERELKERLNHRAFLQSKPALAEARDADVPNLLFLEMILAIFD
jgi:hypothetical protein